MKIWIDTEFNSYKGALISMALVAEDGSEFYESLGCADPNPWVAEHVMPILDKPAISYGVFQGKLQSFLCSFPSIELISDWPEDLQHFLDTLISGPGERINSPPITLTFRSIDSVSAIPHNALADARGIRDADMGITP